MSGSISHILILAVPFIFKYFKAMLIFKYLRILIFHFGGPTDSNGIADTLI